MSVDNKTAPGSLMDSQEKEAAIQTLEDSPTDAEAGERLDALESDVSDLQALDTAAVAAIKTVVITDVGTLVFAVGGRLTSFTPA